MYVRAQVEKKLSGLCYVHAKTFMKYSKLPLGANPPVKGLAPFCCLYREGVDGAVSDLSQACLISLTLVEEQVRVCLSVGKVLSFSGIFCTVFGVYCCTT